MKVQFTVFVGLLLVEGLTSARRQRSDPFPKVLAESRSTCGKVPAVQSHESLRSQPTVVGFGEIPWQVGIFYGQDGSFMCSGTLISKAHVLTAAICLASIESHGDLILRIGDWDISGQDSAYEAYQEFRTTAKKVVFLEENGGIELNPTLRTVALLILKEPVDFSLYPHVAPICLPALAAHTRSVGVKEEVNNCSVSGWGYQESNETTEMSPLGSQYSFDNYKPKLDTPDLLSNQSAGNSERDDNKLPRSLTITSRQESLGPILLSIPLLFSKRARETYAALEPTGEFNWEQQNPSTADLIADEYFDSNLADGLDPVVNEELEFLQAENRVTGPVSTEILPLFKGNQWDMSAEDAEVKSTVSPAEYALHQSMFRHKEKYKKGKQFQPIKAGNGKTDEEKPKMVKDGDEVEVEKRSEPLSLSTPSPSQFTTPGNVVKEGMSVTTGSVLKQRPVTLQRSCQVLPEVETGDTLLSKACVTPSEPTVEPEGLCMADLGSPITCRAPLEKKRRTRSISYSSPKNQDIESGGPQIKISSSNGQPSETRFVLFGIVTWKRPCYERDEYYLQRFTFVTETEEFLPILLKTLAKENHII